MRQQEKKLDYWKFQIFHAAAKIDKKIFVMANYYVSERVEVSST